jgi:membrane associated rhomboid family serine protease
MSESDPVWRRIPPAVLVLIAVIVAAFLILPLLGEAQQNSIYYAFAIIPVWFDGASVYHFTAWYEALGPLLGHVFLHAGWLHVGMNVLVFMQAAPFVANKLGAGRFLMLFFGSAVGAAVAYILINAHAQTPAIGASGAVCGVFGAYFLSVRRSWREALADSQVRNAGFAFLFINVFLAGVASVSGFLPIAWEAHLGGFVVGAAPYPLLARRVARRPWD